MSMNWMGGINPIISTNSDPPTIPTNPLSGLRGRGSSPKLPQKKLEIEREHTSQAKNPKAKAAILAMTIFCPLAHQYFRFEYWLL